MYATFMLIGDAKCFSVEIQVLPSLEPSEQEA